jgi:hypothetical protein
MIRRRSIHDPLTDRTHPHWLVVSNMQGQILECKFLEPGADLWAALARTMDHLTSEGWTIEDDGRLGDFFCCRDGERRFVHLRPTDPAAPPYGPSWHSGCPGREE